MGGQACVFYGAAEFSRDTDLLILADAANLAGPKTARCGRRQSTELNSGVNYQLVPQILDNVVCAVPK